MFVACPSLKQEASTRVHTSESLVWRFLELLIVMAAETPRRRPSHSRRIPVQKTLFGAPVTGQSFSGWMLLILFLSKVKVQQREQVTMHFKIALDDLLVHILYKVIPPHKFYNLHVHGLPFWKVCD